ncbi:hypothetical protein [Chelativorans sp. Marseille-P2723]|uniref:hypothetical protein n=1 Tax=Chelativorans sp. Marseille-P2723 TaxID=2709133 RepID=UPI00156DD111|nr:hypothetical protein [Chelativorans sp. Marseille-P2723]
MKALLLLVSATLAGCVSSPGPKDYAAHDLSRTELHRIEQDVRGSLQNPDALFSGLKAARSSSGELTVCGWVNLRDETREFVNYVGHRPFAVTYDHEAGTLSDFQMVRFAMIKAESPPLYHYCAQRGIPL